MHELKQRWRRRLGQISFRANQNPWPASPAANRTRADLPRFTEARPLGPGLLVRPGAMPHGQEIFAPARLHPYPTTSTLHRTVTQAVP